MSTSGCSVEGFQTKLFYDIIIIIIYCPLIKLFYDIIIIIIKLSVNKINRTQRIHGKATLLATLHFQHYLKIFFGIKY